MTPDVIAGDQPLALDPQDLDLDAVALLQADRLDVHEAAQIVQDVIARQLGIVDLLDREA